MNTRLALSKTRRATSLSNNVHEPSKLSDLNYDAGHVHESEDNNIE